MKKYTHKTSGYVYFLHCRGARAIKIGFSENISQRLTTLTNNSPLPVVLLKYVRASFAVERVLLLLFSPHCTKNEWFSEHPDLLSFIDNLINTEELTMEGLLKKIIA